MKIWAFIPAGGVGTRMGAAMPKQYLHLGGQPLVQRSINKLNAHKRIHAVVAGISKHDTYWESHSISGVSAVTWAGDERANTVLAGLNRLIELAHKDDWVMVHDAARPLVEEADIDRLVQHGMKTDDGGLLAISVTDTIKQTDNARIITRTLERSNIWRAATPQIFPLRLLNRCLQQAIDDKVVITDEASAMEHGGYKPLVIPCDSNNIKITTPDDLEYAHWVLKRKESL